MGLVYPKHFNALAFRFQADRQPVSAAEPPGATKMAIYRSVSKSDAATKELAVEFLLQDTGGAVQWDTTFPIIEEEDCFRIPAWSADGRAAMPLSVVRNLQILGKDADGYDLRERPYDESAGPNPTDARLEELKTNAANFYKLLRGE